jgi:uncharacterized membrane-anchored protein
MNRSNRSILMALLLIVVIQSLVLIIMIANRQAVLSSDDVVVLETRPIDPRSLFRGDYVRLNYEINNLQLHELSGDKHFKVNDTVYVVLEKQGEYWESRAIYLHRPELLTGQLMIQGVVKRVDSRRWDSAKNVYSDITSLQISYGIENYFVPEGEGLKLERPEPGDKVTLEIALDKSGHAAIKTLLLNGVPQYQESLF